MAAAPKFRGRAFRFAVVGAVCTLLYLIMFVLLRKGMGAQWANLVALLISAVANTMLNKRVTFGMVGRPGPREHAQGLAVFALGAALTSAALWALHAGDPGAGPLVEVVVLVASTCVATVVRFALFSRWVFAPPGTDGTLAAMGDGADAGPTIR